jgi:CRISPR-associated protein Cmr2
VSDHLLIWTLGPVQPFIKAARKSQDLWIGSFLLSSLMEAALGTVEPPAEVIYPFEKRIDPQNHIPDLPNTFVARCTRTDVPLIARRAHEAIDSRWNSIQQRVWRNLTTAVAEVQVAQSQWDEHTNPANIFEVYWVAAPIGTDYGATFQSLRAGLNDRKRLRAFRQLLQTGEKSTITGEYAALHQPAAPQREAVRDLWRRIASGLQRGHKYIRADGTERLSAIDVVKRLAASGPNHPLPVDFNRFPSTSTVAAAPFLAAVLNYWSSTTSTSMGKAIIDWLSTLQNPFGLGVADEGAAAAMPYFERQAQQFASTDPRWRLLKQDGDALFPATYQLKRLTRDFGLPEDLAMARAPEIEEQCRSAVSMLRALVTMVCETPSTSIVPPIPYFTVLLLDGDSMGDIIGDINDIEAHRDISQALSVFARQHARHIVEHTAPARLVYAGGDDVLALVPLEAALPLAEQLRVAFADALRSVVKNRQPHASVGICIAHHQDPLGRTLRTARAAEEAAKERYGRNSIVVTLLRRSGEHTSVGAPWQYQYQKNGQIVALATVDLLTIMFDHFRSGRLSPKLAHLVAAEAPVLTGLAPDAQRSELKRLLCRQRADVATLTDVDADSLAARLVAVGEAIELQSASLSARRSRTEYALPIELRAEGPRRGIVEVSGWLSVLAFMSRGGQE